ncbi:MAG: murein biosynthesis integral membrane protein MurJ [Candidatus Portnoybacteria bacterium RBG_13_41_18]|uniref:Probable lipid II flippase MurJ n=1 Tax=Candidatus Portnoybacteria bacterium RBG_13_41_18 TaxID=1801991 RepID=A0A1G2F5L7_9BACT|nr:MAG: murein biosynthesis integral membrane protein MurJ [Candidatus Portnoybacteria bacterium RBG_13_41_18]
MIKIFSFLNGQSKSIASAAILLGAASLASKFLGMIRERLLVGAFGAGDNLDAYFAAFQIPNFAFNLLVSATLSVAFIPVFCEYLNRDKREAWKIASSVLNLMIIIMGFLSLIFFIFAPQLVKIISPGYSGEKYDLTLNLTRILLLSPWFFSISAIFSAILNSFRSFVLVAIAPLVYNLSIIAGILFLAPIWGIYGVAVGVVGGAFLHILVQVPGVKKIGFVWQAIIDYADRGVKTIFKLIIPRILSIDISQISQLIGTIIGSTLMVGSVAIFNLIYNIEAVPIGVFAVSFVVSAFPNLSHAIARQDKASFKNDFSYTVRQILFFLLPLAILTFIFRAQIVRLIIGTSNLTWDETRLASGVLAIFAVSFIFQGIGPLLSRAFFALKNTITPLVVSLFSILINLSATFIFLLLLDNNSGFTRFLISTLKLDGLSDIRALALPFGFSVASIFYAVALLLFLRNKFGYLDGKKIFISFLKYLLAGLIAGFVGYAGLYFIEPFINTLTFLGILIQLVFATIIALAAFTIVALLLRSEEMVSFVNSIERKMGKSVRSLDIGEAEKL